MSQSTEVSQNRSDRLNAVMDELHSESDRASVILGIAEIDHALRDLLEAFFVAPSQSSKKYGFTLFGPDEPAGTLSARIELSYRAGLIPEWCQREAHILRRIRNEFAHKSLGHTFNSSPTRELVQSLSLAAELQANTSTEDFPDDFWSNPKNLFALSAGMVTAEIVCAHQNVLDGNTRRPEACIRGVSFGADSSESAL